MEEVWGGNNFNYSEDVSTGVKIAGTTIPVEPGASFRDTIKQVSLDAGFGKYRVYLNGNEIRPSEAPQVFNTGDVVEVRPFDTAGL